MKYIKIREKNYNEVLKKLKKEYGDDAIPISHKYVKEGGLLNSRFFAKDVVELTAAVQDKKTFSDLNKSRKKIDITVGDSEKKELNRDERKEFDDIVLNTQKKTNLHKPDRVRDTGMNASEQITPKPQRMNKLSDTVLQQSAKTSIEGKPTDEQKARLESIRKGIGDETRTFDANARIKKDFEEDFNEIKDTLNKLIKKYEMNEPFIADEDVIMKPYVDILKNNDFDANECNQMIKKVKNSISKDDLKDKYKIEKSLKDLLKSRIITTGPLKTGNKKKVVMFIGPTGVGKTTTMAKLGALNSLREGKNIVFITIDNYRIAATEQLKKYAEIMRIPVYAVNEQNDFKNLIEKEKADIIMVDTSGRSHNNTLKISEIKSFAEQIDYDVEKILCVSANTKKTDLDNIFKSFETITFDSVIITKVDETTCVGNVVGVADKYKKPIAYITNGQEVPNDIAVADPDKIVDMIIGNINI
ncbi:flagellar biosynthesis protein FlhF [Spirochaetota bacterium]